MRDYHLILTDYNHGSKAVYKTDLNYLGTFSGYNFLTCNVNSLRFVTDIDFSADEVFQSDQLEHVAQMCPNLHRLNLCMTQCLNSLQGLQAIAGSCCNLQGLNLLGIHTIQVENQLQLWEILSNLKLTHLGIMFCVVLPLQNDYVYRERLITLYQKCMHLRALHLQPAAEKHLVNGSYDCDAHNIEECSKCDASIDQHVLLLSHFPSLTYCMLDQMAHGSTIVRDITSSCKKLKYFNYTHVAYNPISLDVIKIQCDLQQLCLVSPVTNIPDTFMEMVSAHGGLEHVAICVQSITIEGLTTLITNSLKLSTLCGYTSSA